MVELGFKLGSTCLQGWPCRRALNPTSPVYSQWLSSWSLSLYVLHPQNRKCNSSQNKTTYTEHLVPCRHSNVSLNQEARSIETKTETRGTSSQRHTPSGATLLSVTSALKSRHPITPPSLLPPNSSTVSIPEFRPHLDVMKTASTGSEIRQTWVQIPASALLSCVSLEKPLNLSEPVPQSLK